MNAEKDPLAEFRRLVSRRARQSPARWDDSRRWIEPQSFSATLETLLRRLQENNLPPSVKEQARLAFRQGASRVQDLGSEALKTLTGFPPAKALRALCVYFDLVPHPGSRWPVPAMAGEAVERVVRRSTNPFDLLGEADVASVLDLGAGDLSFAGELAEHYRPLLEPRRRDLILHCIDRLDPASKLGGPLHPGQVRVRQLQSMLGSSFRFYGNQDMSALEPLDDQGKLAPRYTIVTCWAPATPTFAYEPARLSASVIAQDLRRTKGTYKQTRFEGEPALEVQEGGRSLLFPSWKFDIRGPVVLLELLARRGLLGVLGAVDSQVFWETLSQLLDDPRYRPPDLPFTAENLPDIFGEVHRRLDRLAIGDSIDLADLGALRSSFPATDRGSSADSRTWSFRHVRIRRGATFPGVPASSTARKFSSMVEESTPWMLTLVPEQPDA